MKQYLTKFSTRAEYTAALENLDFPNVTYLSEDDELVFSQVKPEPEIDWSKEYLTFLALDDCTFEFSNRSGMDTGTTSYSLDDGETWTELEGYAPTLDVMAGGKIMFKGTISGDGGLLPEYSVVSTGRFEAMGNPYSLYYGDDFGADTLSEDKCPANLFSKCTGLTSAENLSLPAATLTEYCYSNMFNGCTSLTTAPALPAATLTEYCYSNMFNGCTSLTTAPELPATELAGSCYESMFSGCTSLTTSPELPATALADNCYNGMFEGCTSLTTAPELPATELAGSCYVGMFRDCTSLTTAPALPATTLAEHCYNGMFYGCTALTNAPALPATTLARYCYNGMFYGCTALTNAPALPATTLAEHCYNGMFYGCTSLNYIKMLATDVSATNCLKNWVNEVSSTGTFVKHPNANLPSGVSGIPEGWTVQTATA